MRRARDSGPPNRPNSVPPMPDLVGRRVRARLARLSDAGPLLTFHIRNRKHLDPWAPPIPEDFLTIGYWQRWTSAAKPLFDQDRSVRLVVYLRQDDATLIGQINFSQIHRGAMGACTVGYQIDQAMEGQGLMAEGLRLAVGYMFKAYGLHRVVATYMPENRRSAVLLRRRGFEVEGYAREFLFINGAWRDHVLTALIRPEDAND